jgi:molybdenum cofactor cytidylyltransferase
VAGYTAGLVLAAGAGVRFGDGIKQLAPLGGRPLLEWALDAQCAVAEVERVVVVLGARAGEIRPAIQFGRAEVVVCEDWERGQAASLRHGLAELVDAERVLVTLGDQPLITAAIVARFARELPGTRAVYDGRPGHPVVLGLEQTEALRHLTGDRGARELLRGGRVVEVGELGCGRDVDTPADLEEVRRYIASRPAG